MVWLELHSVVPWRVRHQCSSLRHPREGPHDPVDVFVQHCDPSLVVCVFCSDRSNVAQVHMWVTDRVHLNVEDVYQRELWPVRLARPRVQRTVVLYLLRNTII